MAVVTIEDVLREWRKTIQVNDLVRDIDGLLGTVMSIPLQDGEVYDYDFRVRFEKMPKPYDDVQYMKAESLFPRWWPESQWLDLPSPSPHQSAER